MPTVTEGWWAEGGCASCGPGRYCAPGNRSFVVSSKGLHLMGVDPNTLAVNLFLVIGVVVLLGVGLILLLVAWTGFNMLYWLVQRSWIAREVRRKTLRADGKPFPPCAEGVCQTCGRGSGRIYFLPTGDELCPICYDRSWRTASSPALLTQAVDQQPTAPTRTSGQVQMPDPGQCAPM